jgi:predicted site-specific integrase-resolvase
MQQLIFNQTQAARLIGVHTRTLRRWTTEGRVPKIDALPGAHYHITQLMALGMDNSKQQDAMG